MNHFGAACASGPVELRTRQIEALSIMMSKAATLDDEEILSRWFVQLGAPFAELILGYLKKPFEDLRIAGLTLICHLMDYEWARRMFSYLSG